jgi:hypothetical protein
VCLEHDVFPESDVGDGVLGLLAIGLAFLWTVDAAEPDTFSALVVEDFDGVAVDYPTTFPLKSAACAMESQLRNNARAMRLARSNKMPFLPVSRAAR